MIQVQRPEDETTDTEKAIALASELLERARELQTPAERRQQAELDRLIQHDADKATLVEMTDQAFRTQTPARVADQLAHVLDVQGVPQFFNPIERAMLRGFQAFGQYLPGVAVPLVKEKMRQETANVILPAEPEVLRRHLSERQSHGVRMNVNLLGEALVGEDETGRRLRDHLDLLRMPEVQCLSVKLTTLYSQVSPAARRHTIRVIADRLEVLYRNANHSASSSVTGKLVYLDMEEYRDLYLTADVLRETLRRDELRTARAGIALQAYVPDSFHVMRDLIEFSRQRVDGGGQPLTIRLVKGANMEMERVHASVGGFAVAPYESKLDTDANFKCMLRELIDAAEAGIVDVGVASHNLFDVALAMVWTQSMHQNHARSHGERPAGNVRFEMLEGMANHQRRAITETHDDMLLYAPACRRDDFLHAIGYLVRRLDENTGRENFLRHSHCLQTGSPEFQRLADSFAKSVAHTKSVSHAPKRTQDRRQSPSQPPAVDHWTDFINEPDTDWSLPHNADWIADVLDAWRSRLAVGAETIHPVIADPSHDSAWVVTTDSRDVSRPSVVTAHVALASLSAVESAVASATTSSWLDSDIDHRHDLLRRVAQLLRERRGDLLAAMVADAGKAVMQGDGEVSEAIDFCEFYPLSMRSWLDDDSLRISPRGVVAVITPWNFPLAIACGGIAAALSAGNPVVLKPSLETPLSAWQLCQAFWDAGVPHDALQFVPCNDDVAQAGLVESADVDTVVLTGGTETAKAMLAARPGLHLLAETGGKNVTIVTAMADRDLAIKHVLQSAFGHSGQKCSATSLLLLQAEVFDDPEFKRTLADAVESLHVGSAWDLQNIITPLVTPPNATLQRGLKEIEDDEQWLVMPRHDVADHGDDNPTLYHPGVKWNVTKGSFTVGTELFGPVIGVMRFGSLDEAIEIVRSTGYGLTSGLESLDDREIELWKSTVPAGNLYINRPTTGAIVLRQPFGGVGLSAYGPGVKAGGPNYVLALAHIEDATQSSDESRLKNAQASQRDAVASVFDHEHDTFGLIGQDNLRRYRHVEGMAMRVQATDDRIDIEISLSAAIAVGTPVTVSISPDSEPSMKCRLDRLADEHPSLVDPHVQAEPQWLALLQNHPITRLRCFSPITDTAHRVCGDRFITVIREPVVCQGRVECLRYLNEQSVSHDYHRYGNLGRRGETTRSTAISNTLSDP